MPTSAWYKFECLSEHLCEKVHNLDTDTIKIYLTNSAPNAATHAVKTDLAGITEENGYTETDITTATSRTGAVTSITTTDYVEWTASGGSFGPCRYAVVFNDTPTSPADPLIGYYDYGASITVATGEKLKVDFGTSLFTVTAA